MNTGITETIPPGLRSLFQEAGPVIRYRILKDILNRDDSFAETIRLNRAIAALTEVSELASRQEIDGSWGGTLKQTEQAMLRLCELGLETHDAVLNCLDKCLLPTLANGEILWEYSGDQRRFVRDKVFRLITRANPESCSLLAANVETVLAEWERFFTEPSAEAAPTFDGYAAVCCYEWSDDEFPRIRSLIKKLMETAEAASPSASPFAFRLMSKEEYLACPEMMLFELELSARVGLTRDLAPTRWMLEELEARQDADGRFRLGDAGGGELSWYYPLDPPEISRGEIEWTFRAAQIFKLLGYDI